jgi:hypothetical protein
MTVVTELAGGEIKCGGKHRKKQLKFCKVMTRPTMMYGCEASVRRKEKAGTFLDQ